LSKALNPRDHEPLALSLEERSGDPMAETKATNNASPSRTVSASTRLGGWLYPMLRIAFLIFAAWLIWYTAGHWDRWTGVARFETTDDAFVAGDVTPLSARVSGNITERRVVLLTSSFRPEHTASPRNLMFRTSSQDLEPRTLTEKQTAKIRSSPLCQPI
jgi:hypothetical protein